MTKMNPTLVSKKLLDHIPLLDDAGCWTEGSHPCDGCGKTIAERCCDIPGGRICPKCAESVYHHFAAGQEIAGWNPSRFAQALSGGESLRWRLTVLNRYEEAVRLVSKRKNTDIRELHRLLIANMNFHADHPLSHMVRQLALNAVVRSGKPILPLLLDYPIPEEPWQFHYNVVLSASLIALGDGRVQKLVEEAAGHPHSEMRRKVMDFLAGQQSAWAKKLLAQLKKGPDVAALPASAEKTGAVRPAPGQQELFAAVKADVVSIPDELSELETVILDNYSLEVLKTIYDNYLSKVFQNVQFEMSGAASRTKLRKRHYIWALAQAFSSKECFEKLLPILPAGVVRILNRLTWEKGDRSVGSFLVPPLDPPILIPSEQQWNRKTIITEKLNPLYAIIPVRKKYAYHYYGSSDSDHHLYLFLPDILRNHLKKFLPPPEGYHLKALDAIGKTGFIYEDNNQILHQIPLICAYIARGNLKYSKSSGKMLKTSVKEMAAFCGIREFYSEKDPDMAYLGTGLIIDMLGGGPSPEKLSPPEFLRRFFDDFFMNYKPYKSYRLIRMLFHLKGIRNILNGYYENDQHQNEKTVRASLLSLLRALEAGRWYSVQNLFDYCLYRDLDLDIVKRSVADSYLTLEVRSDGDRYYRYLPMEISDSIYNEALLSPFLKGVMFLLAAFGIVDIAYDFPEHARLQKKDKDYLSVFDGLRFVRLTPLGAYVTGLEKEFEFREEAEDGRLVLDEKRFLIHLDGKDRLKAMTLEQMADKVGTNCYKVTSGSFLKGCDTQRDIEKKIRLFKKEISSKPPRIWEDFLKDILDKIDPLIPEPAMEVFRLKEHPELIELMARDEQLQKLILKAEGYHVVIPAGNLGKVKKRLEAFGWL